MALKAKKTNRFVAALARSGHSIYDTIEIGDPKLWIPTPVLEALLSAGLKGLSLTGLPLRTRSKVVKEQVCRILGYPAPPSFKKTKPRFPGQCFDTYIQKSNNLQIWNEELAPTRRYVIIRVSEREVIEDVRVATGDMLVLLDTTGKLTQKYQARLVPSAALTELIVDKDTSRLLPFVDESAQKKIPSARPVDYPVAGAVLPIRTIYKRLSTLVNVDFHDTGHDQERNRGAALHRIVCAQLGYTAYKDDGRFPDIRHQLLEVKLQTAPTIDLGLVCPNSKEALDVPQLSGKQIRHCDVRYALFYAKTDGQRVTLTHFYLTTGEAFFKRFPQCQGKVLNRKLQIPLPDSFFSR